MTINGHTHKMIEICFSRTGVNSCSNVSPQQEEEEEQQQQPQPQQQHN